MPRLNLTCQECSRPTYRIVKGGVKAPGLIHCADCDAKRRKAARDAFLQGGGYSFGSIEAQDAATKSMLSEWADVKQKTESNDRIIRAFIETLNDEQRAAIEESIGDRLDRVMV